MTVEPMPLRRPPSPHLQLRILVTGWRHWPEHYAGVVWDALDAVAGGAIPLALDRHQGWLYAQPARPDWLERPVVLVHGQCPAGGVDWWAERWAVGRGHKVERHPAAWRAHGSRAGMIRNAEMVNLGADVCVAFPGPAGSSKGKRSGTRGCRDLAELAGIEIITKPWRPAWRCDQERPPAAPVWEPLPLELVAA